MQLMGDSCVKPVTPPPTQHTHRGAAADIFLCTVGHGESGEGRGQETQCLVLCLGRQSCFVIAEVVMGDVGVEENIFLRT